MKVLKKELFIYWILNIITLGLFTFYIAYKLNLYEKDVWYCRWYYWVLGFVLGIFPGIVMLLVFSVKIGCLVSGKMNVPGKEIYMLPYPWIICLVVPVLGWTLFILLYLYVHFAYLFKFEVSLRKN